MNRSRKLFYSVFIVLSVFLQSLFFIYYFRSASWDKFYYLKSKIRGLAILCSEISESYKELKQDSHCAIFNIPSTSANYMVIPAHFDIAPVLYKDKKVFFSSDIMGPNIEDYAEWIIDENPNIIILDGPSTYLLGYMFNQINLDRCIENVSKIVKEANFDIMIYDHHLLRERKFREHMGNFYDIVYENRKRVLTAAEWFNLPPLVDLI